MLTRKQQVALDRLLLRREAVFAHIHALESEVCEILGGDYPFSPPPSDLPSLQPRRKLSPIKGTAKTSTVASPRLKVPSLEADEEYEVHYEQEGHEYVERHHDMKALLSLIAIETPELQVLKVEIKRHEPDSVQ